MPKVPSEELDYVEIDRRLVDCAVEALDYAACAGWKLITEACMGGLISTVLSEAERQISAKRLRHTLSSKNASRLKVSARLIEEFGAMSPQVAEVARGGT